MFDFVSSNIFFLALIFLAIGALGSLVFKKSDFTANLWANSFAILGSIAGMASSIITLVFNATFGFSLDSTLPLLSFSFAVDKLSAFFIFVISLIVFLSSIYALGYLKHYYKKYSIGTLGFFYNIFLAGMLMVASAHNALFFLIVWEIMSLASYFLVIFENDKKESIKAGSLYFIMTHIATAFIIFAFLILYTVTGSLDFTTIKENMAGVDPLMLNIVFILVLIGFGTKAGIIPFHIWLPSAHPAAPSHVSALMSGVMIKTGIYMLIRILMDIMPGAPLWWGVLVLILGAVSSLLGVLYALTEHDIKKLLAYHSIENIGIILLGFGSSLIFWSLGMMPLVILGLSAALFHTLNHAVFKALLFLGAGSVISETHTRNIEEYGGLIRFMPQTAFFFLIGSMAISALPPFNGFASEWLTFQSLFAGINSLDIWVRWIFILAGGSLAITGGLAAMCFVKVFGATFLARARSDKAGRAKESGLWMRISLAVLATLTLIIGFFSGFVVDLILGVINSLALFDSPKPSFTSTFFSIGMKNDFASISMPAILMVLISMILFVYVLIYFFTKDRKVVIGRTWDCGTALDQRMEITATGFSRSVIAIFKGVLKPTKQESIEYRDENMRYFQKTNTVALGIDDIYRKYFYEPILAFAIKVSGQMKKIQSGNINTYILYIFLILVAVLLVSNF